MNICNSNAPSRKQINYHARRSEKHQRREWLILSASTILVCGSTFSSDITINPLYEIWLNGTVAEVAEKRNDLKLTDRSMSFQADYMLAAAYCGSQRQNEQRIGFRLMNTLNNSYAAISTAQRQKVRHALSKCERIASGDRNFSSESQSKNRDQVWSHPLTTAIGEVGGDTNIREHNALDVNDSSSPAKQAKISGTATSRIPGTSSSRIPGTSQQPGGDRHLKPGSRTQLEPVSPGSRVPSMPVNRGSRARSIPRTSGIGSRAHPPPNSPQGRISAHPAAAPTSRRVDLSPERVNRPSTPRLNSPGGPRGSQSSRVDNRTIRDRK